MNPTHAIAKPAMMNGVLCPILSDQNAKTSVMSMAKTYTGIVIN
jgi:hypothetical protein